MNVILSAAKNLDARDMKTLRDSSSHSAPQNDEFEDFFRGFLVRSISLSAENRQLPAYSDALRLAFCALRSSQIRLDYFRVPLDLFGRTFRDLQAVVQDNYPVSHTHHEVHVMFYQQNG